MSRTIELSDEIYQHLEEVARNRGITVAEWIAATLPDRSNSVNTPANKYPLSEALEDFIGLMDSSEISTYPGNASRRTPLGDLIAAKLERQGLRRT